MSFANVLNILRPTLPYYLALTKYGLLRITKDCFEFDPNPAAPPIALEMARAVFTIGASSCTESFVMSRTLRRRLPWRWPIPARARHSHPSWGDAMVAPAHPGRSTGKRNHQ